jgi:hypothetical protein
MRPIQSRKQAQVVETALLPAEPVAAPDFTKTIFEKEAMKFFVEGIHVVKYLVDSGITE